MPQPLARPTIERDYVIVAARSAQTRGGTSYRRPMATPAAALHHRPDQIPHRGEREEGVGRRAGGLLDSLCRCGQASPGVHRLWIACGGPAGAAAATCRPEKIFGGTRGRRRVASRGKCRARHAPGAGDSVSGRKRAARRTGRGLPEVPIGFVQRAQTRRRATAAAAGRGGENGACRAGRRRTSRRRERGIGTTVLRTKARRGGSAAAPGGLA
jgi:hypothetical protein